MYRIYKDNMPLEEFYKTKKAAQMACECYNVKYQYCTERPIFEAVKVDVIEDIQALRQERLKQYRHQYVYVFIETVGKDKVGIDVSLQEPSKFFDPTSICAYKNGSTLACYFYIPQLWLDEQKDVENWCFNIAKKAWKIMKTTRWKQIHQSDYRVTREGEVERYENDGSCSSD